MLHNNSFYSPHLWLRVFPLEIAARTQDFFWLSKLPNWTIYRPTKSIIKWNIKNRDTSSSTSRAINSSLSAELKAWKSTVISTVHWTVFYQTINSNWNKLNHTTVNSILSAQHKKEQLKVKQTVLLSNNQQYIQQSLYTGQELRSTVGLEQFPKCNRWIRRFASHFQV